MNRYDRLFAAVLVAAIAAQPARAQETAKDGTVNAALRPLGSLVHERVVVLPVFRFVAADSVSWMGKTGGQNLLRTLDDELTFAFAERGTKGFWSFPRDLVYSAKRNPGVAPDPYALSVSPMVAMPIRSRNGDPVSVPEPFASQIRAMTAIGDGRYALLPLSLTFQRIGGDTARAVLRFELIDTRLATVLWAVNVVSDPMTSYTPALPATLASRAADLVAASE